MTTLVDLTSEILPITEGYDDTAALIDNIRTQLLALISSAGLPGQMFMIIGPKHLELLLIDHTTSADLYLPEVVIPLDDKGRPLPARPPQGHCGTLRGTPLILDPLAKHIGVGLAN